MPNFDPSVLEMVIVISAVVYFYYLLWRSLVWAAKRFKRWWKEDD